MFLEYLRENRIAHGEVGLPTVLEFLAYHGRVKHREYCTIAVYRGALKQPLKYRCNVNIDCPESVSFMRGFFNERPPARRAPTAEWGLSDLLGLLRGPPFEPLETVSWRCCTQKTLILILLATGRRIGEVANISRSFVRSGPRITLLWLPEFLAKYEQASFRPDHPSILPLTSDDESDLLLCPVRAWSIFLRRRSQVPGSRDDERLWTHQESSLSYLFKQVSIEADLVSGGSAGPGLGPHQMRKFAASYSKAFLGDSEGRIQLLRRLMGCSSLSVLQRVYFRDVPPVEFPCVVPLGSLFPP